MVLKVPLNTGINRIRLEFKVFSIPIAIPSPVVLIESDWNLKTTTKKSYKVGDIVLIESDWNLKLPRQLLLFSNYPVLIESDWNLKA